MAAAKLNNLLINVTLFMVSQFCSKQVSKLSKKISSYFTPSHLPESHM